MYNPEATALPEHGAIPPERLLWTAGGISAMPILTALENLLIPVATNLPTLPALPHAASTSRQAVWSFLRFALDLASM